MLQTGEGFLHAAKLRQQNRGGNLLDVLLGVVDPCRDVGAAIGEGIGGGKHLSVQGALHGAESGTEALSILRRHNVDHAFRLGKGHFAVHQGTAGVLTRFGGTGARSNGGGKHL